MTNTDDHYPPSDAEIIMDLRRQLATAKRENAKLRKAIEAIHSEKLYLGRKGEGKCFFWSVGCKSGTGYSTLADAALAGLAEIEQETTDV